MPDTLRAMYHERLWPTPTWFLTALLLIPAVILALAPINLTLGIVMSIVIYFGAVAFFLAKSPTIAVTEADLIAGRGRIEREFLGQAHPIAEEDRFAQLHYQLDARAWLCVRGWLPGLVRVELNDPNDPTPYWLVSSRHPERLAAALNGASGA